MAESLLIFDADDTLWESNTVFEEVYADFQQWLNAEGYDDATTLQAFRAHESHRTTTLGTGHGVFCGTLEAVGAELGGDDLAQRVAKRIPNYVRTFERLGTEVYPEVRESLEHLSTTHRLVLLTRGEHNEQTAKISASGLSNHFDRVFIVNDKTDETYTDTLRQLGAHQSHAWMVGNSMKHDIAPALRTGLGAVHVNRGPGWVLEQAELPQNTGRLIVVPDLFGLVDAVRRDELP